MKNLLSSKEVAFIQKTYFEKRSQSSMPSFLQHMSSESLPNIKEIEAWIGTALLNKIDEICNSCQDWELINKLNVALRSSLIRDCLAGNCEVLERLQSIPHELLAPGKDLRSLLIKDVICFDELLEVANKIMSVAILRASKEGFFGLKKSSQHPMESELRPLGSGNFKNPTT